MTRRFGRAWTPEEDETIRKMAGANASPFLIAAKLKRTVSSVQRRAPILGAKIRSERQRKSDVSKAQPVARQ